MSDGASGVDRTVLETHLTKDYHRVEKGLALREPRRPFGRDVERRLEQNLRLALESGRAPSTEVDFEEYARQALAGLREWNDSAHRSDLLSPVVRQTYQENSSADPTSPMENFFASRASVRDFQEKAVVDRGLIDRAAAIAQTAPSVCNRQSGRLHVFSGHDDVTRVLSNQNGNAGFRESVPHVAVITVDRRLFSGPEERNQRWVDGGLFAMTFVWGLQAMGVATCMLNWSVKHDQDARMRDVIRMSEHEDIVCLVAFGYRRPESRVALSPKRPLRSVLSYDECV